MMEEYDFQRLKLTLFNHSNSISHVHVFGDDGSGRSEMVRQILRNADEEWICVFSDFIYGDGSLKLLLESFARELSIKSKGEKIEDFFRNIYEQFDWPDATSRKIILFLDHAEAVVNYHPATIRCFFNSYKAIPGLTVRFVTCSSSCWESYQSNISLGHLPIVQFHVKMPSKETCIQLITACSPNIPTNWVQFCVNLLAPHCKSPNTLLAIINEAYRNSKEVDTAKAKDMLQKAAEEKLGMVRSTHKTPSSSTLSSDFMHSFESMPLAMRYMLIASYCASNNAVATDRRFFVKNHGRDKRSEKQELNNEVNRQLKDIEPKAADLQRIVCIYEILIQLNHEAPLRGFDVKNLISTLNSMGLVATTNLSNLDMPKIKCLISLESALKIASSLKMKLREYLEYSN